MTTTLLSEQPPTVVREPGVPREPGVSGDDTDGVDGPSVSEHWQLRVRGAVQGVGFRPAVWQLAHRLGLRGEVLNDGEGVLVRLAADEASAREFERALRAEAPPLSAIESTELAAWPEPGDYPGFDIVPSALTASRTQVTADAYCCPECLAETLDPSARRHRYPFTNCTHCGPRFSIVRGIPYDRAQTTMSSFPMCDACRAEYEDPADRRFHAQPIACPECGPKAWLVRSDGGPAVEVEGIDDVDRAARLIAGGEIVAIRGIGGFHLACDATNAEAVETLRRRKQRDAKPFALMARDVEVIRAYCDVSAQEQALLESPEAPIVLLPRRKGCTLPAAIAPGLSTLGFLLPTSPLHHLLLGPLGRPAVMTSGNRSSEPQVTSNDEVAERLGDIADYVLLHDREIANRVDDSVVRVALGVPRPLRRARGYAPRPLPLPPGFERADGIVAFGGELKSTFCLVSEGHAVLSPHQGDLEDARTYDDYVHQLELLGRLFEHRPTLRACDSHPEYLASKLARARCRHDGLPRVEIQHHHAHVAACMAENGLPIDTRPVLGICLDGLGWGDDGTVWGGEFLLADYRGYRRLGCLRPVAMPGGAQAVRQPWRNTYAHLDAALGWRPFAAEYRDLELFRDLEARPRATLDRMVERGVNSPLSSSCGRLFDAVAGAVGLCRDEVAYEGQAAMELESRVDPAILDEPLPADGSDRLYPFGIERHAMGRWYVDPGPMWHALLDDLRAGGAVSGVSGVDVSRVAARFHRGLARAVSRLAAELLAVPVAADAAEDLVALSGGCFHNRILFELTVRELEAHGIGVLSHSAVPAGDGGLALGQAAIAAAHQLAPADPRAA